MAEENGEVSKKSSSGKGLLIVLIILITILLVAVLGVGYLILEGKKSDKDSTQATTQTTQNVGNTSPDANFKADVNELVLNLTDSKGREKMMKLSFSIKSNDPTIAKTVEDYKAEITDVVISLVGSRSSEELLTVSGKTLLKNELIAEINSVLNHVMKSNSNLVSTILFTTFVIK